MIALDLIDALTVDDAAQAHAKEWAQRVRELHERAEALSSCAKSFASADDLDRLEKTLADLATVLAEIDQLNRRMTDLVSRLRAAPGRPQ
jgi:hypothetical protein